MKTKLRDLMQYVLASLIIIGFFTLLIILVYRPMPMDNKDLLNMVVGALLLAFASVVGYYFGSSIGSARKEKIIADYNRNGNSDNTTDEKKIANVEPESSNV